MARRVLDPEAATAAALGERSALGAQPIVAPSGASMKRAALAAAGAVALLGLAAWEWVRFAVRVEAQLADLDDAE